MRHTIVACVALLTSGTASAQMYPPPLVHDSGSPRTWASPPANAHAVTGMHRAPRFEPVQLLGHQDDFWSNMLVGDADHDGREEVVLRSVPIPPGQNQIVFYEDDGTGHFAPVHAIDLDDGGVLAMGDVDQDGRTDLFFERAIGSCQHEFVRWEASSPSGFPDHEVWKARKEGNVVDMNAVIADTDGDGVLELVTEDANFSCIDAQLKIFESSGGDSMRLVYSPTVGGFPGNPVVADFDRDGRMEIALAFGLEGKIELFESTGNDSYHQTFTETHTEYNAYQLAVIDAESPDGYPVLLLAGQDGEYRIGVYESLAGDSISRIHTVVPPALCGASIPQIATADVIGTPEPEVLLDRLCGPIPVYHVGKGGVMALVALPFLDGSIEVIGTEQRGGRSGALVIGSSACCSHPNGETVVLEVP